MLSLVKLCFSGIFHSSGLHYCEIFVLKSILVKKVFQPWYLIGWRSQLIRNHVRKSWLISLLFTNQCPWLVNQFAAAVYMNGLVVEQHVQLRLTTFWGGITAELVRLEHFSFLSPRASFIPKHHLPWTHTFVSCYNRALGNFIYACPIDRSSRDLLIYNTGYQDSNPSDGCLSTCPIMSMGPGTVYRGLYIYQDSNPRDGCLSTCPIMSIPRWAQGLYI